MLVPAKAIAQNLKPKPTPLLNVHMLGRAIFYEPRHYEVCRKPRPPQPTSVEDTFPHRRKANRPL